jgi:tetratricopeptide (TPR) repeat protein
MSVALRRDTLSSFLIPVLAAATVALCAPAFCQTLSTAKAKFDSGDYAGAAADFESVVQRGATIERPEAAAFVIRSLSQAGNHSQVVDKYDRILTAARGTQFEGECAFERAKSTQVNAKDTTSALAQYAEVLAKYPGNVFAASGALYQRGTIELDKLKTPNAALSTFEQVARSYPSSPFVDDALVKLAEAGVGAERLDVIDSAGERLRAMKARPGLLQTVQLQRGEYMAKVKGSRREAVEEYRKAYEDHAAAGRTQSAAIALVRAADYVPGGDFRAAAKLYQRVLDDHPKAPAALRHWALLHLGIYEYQAGDEAKARATVEQVIALKPGGAVEREARKYLKGIAEPESVESLQIVYDRGIRQNQTGQGLDRVFWDMQRVISKSRGEAFERFVSSPETDDEEAAQMMYRLCYAYYNGGYGAKAFELAGRILEEFQPRGVTRQQCLFMRAHLMGRAGRHDEAVPVWRTLIDSNPKREVLVDAYLELSRALDFSGDALAAVLALDELSVRLPNSLQAEFAADRRKTFETEDGAIIAKAEEQRLALIAKWRGKEPPSEVAGANPLFPLPAPQDSSTLAGGAQ